MGGTFTAVTTKLEGWMAEAVEMLPNVFAAFLVVLAFWIAARLIRRILFRGLRKMSESDAVPRFVSSSVGFTIVTVGFLVALGILNLDKTVTSLLAGAGVLGLALGTAFQSVAANLLAGILLSVRKPFRPGDVIETNGHLGVVASVNLRATILNLLQGQVAYLPNKDVLESPIVNYSTGRRRIDLPVGISYGEDLDNVRQVTLEAVRGVSSRIPDEEPELFYEGYGDSSINFVVRFWIPFQRQVDFVAARSEAVMRIKAAYNRAGITIPFPIRTLDFGIKGGTTLAENVEPIAGRRGA